MNLGKETETVTNALCHRDYESRQVAEVNVYLDSVEVSNPGLFPPGDTPERHLSGESVASECRNPLIAETLFRAGMIERYGSGIMRIKSACDQAGVPFSYTQRAGRTSVSFERVGARGDGVAQTSNEAALVLGVGRRQGQRVLVELRDAGLAASTRSGNVTTWRPNE